MRTCSPQPVQPGRAEARSAAPELWQRYSRGADLGTENELVQECVPLVKVVVGRLAMTLPPHVELGDLHSAGLLGLLHAIRNYDPLTGVPFECYARVRIRGAVLDELRRMDPVSRSVHDRAREIQATMWQLEQKLGRVPTDEQMAKALGLTLDNYRRRLDEVRPAAYVCLDSTNDKESGESGLHHEVVADSTTDDPAELVSRRELSALILERLKRLPEIQRKVLALYYEQGLLLREIATAVGLTESRICQIHAQTILSLKAYLRRYEEGHEPATPFVVACTA